jgi:amino acid transporter
MAGLRDEEEAAWRPSSPELLRSTAADPEDDEEALYDHNADLLTTHEARDLHRGLAQRHLSMLGIAGAIGTGLFLGLGGAVQTGGPLGALLGYAVVGLVVCAVQFALGEVAALLPVTGSFVRHAEFLVDPALGVALGYNLVYGNMLSIPSEITAICVLFQFWTTDVSPAVFIVVFIMLTVGVGFARIRVFGEVEYIFAWLKIALVVFLIILGLVIASGGIPGTPAVGFRYWRDPGPFVEYIASGAWGNFLGMWEALTGAVFSFAGVESIAMAAAETRDPRKAIPAACKRVFLRIFLFYMLAILVVGMLVASNDERLGRSSGNAAQSPFVIAASAAGLPAIPSVVNAVVITSAWSASNQSLLAGSRVLYGLALKGQAPRVFLRTTSWGAPYMCILAFAAAMLLSFLSLSSDALTVFWWFVDLTAAGVLVSWTAILFNHIRLRRALQIQEIPVSRLPWYNRCTSVFSSPRLNCPRRRSPRLISKPQYTPLTPPSS